MKRPLKKRDSSCDFQPPTREIGELVNPQTGWLPLENLITGDRYISFSAPMRGSYLDIKIEELNHIHPKDICILRIRHEMAKEMITAIRPNEHLYLLPNETVTEIDDRYPKIVNTISGGYSDEYRKAYEFKQPGLRDKEFMQPAFDFVDIVKSKKEIFKDDLIEIWVDFIPYHFSIGQLKDLLSEKTGIIRDNIRYVKLYPPNAIIGTHGGRGSLFIKTKSEADALISFHNKIPSETKSFNKSKPFFIGLRYPAEKKKREEVKKIERF